MQGTGKYTCFEVDRGSKFGLLEINFNPRETINDLSFSKYENSTDIRSPTDLTLIALYTTKCELVF